jgi:hypothetical protein
MGFIGYRRHERGVRVFLECSEAELGAGTVSCTYPVDVVFTDNGVRFEGLTDIFALKKFYKLVNSLEERARENNRDRQVVFHSPENLLEHLRLTRNAREFAEDPPSRLDAPSFRT